MERERERKRESERKKKLLERIKVTKHDHYGVHLYKIAVQNISFQGLTSPTQCFDYTQTLQLTKATEEKSASLPSLRCLARTHTHIKPHAHIKPHTQTHTHT